MKTTNPRRSPRHRSKLEKLPTDQRQQLDAWLKEGITYSEISERLASQFGVKAVPSSLSTYFSRHLSAIAPASAEVRDLHIGEGTIEFEIVTRVRVRRSELMADGDTLTKPQ